MRKPLRGWLSSFREVSARNPRRSAQVELLNHLCFSRQFRPMLIRRLRRNREFTMNADCAFIIGSTHSICQDYAVAVPEFNSNGVEVGPYVALSDGCSSSPDTDVGARLLTCATRQIFNGAVEVTELHKESAQLALRWAELLGLPIQSVDATLLTVHLDRDDLIIGCSGDGVVVLETREGRLDVYAISSPSGYPFYPCYAHQPERLDELIARGRTYKELKHFRRVSADEPLTLVNESTSDSLTEVFRLKVSDHKYAA